MGSGVNHIYTPLLLGFQGSFLRYKVPLFVCYDALVPSGTVIEKNQMKGSRKMNDHSGPRLLLDEMWLRNVEEQTIIRGAF